jgi:alpha-galactosidase
MYRLSSPYESDHAAVMYVETSGKKSVLFTFDMHPRYAEKTLPLRLAGLHPDKKYELKEINLLPKTNSRLSCNGKTYSGDFLMKVGIPVFSSQHTVSHVIEIVELD